LPPHREPTALSSNPSLGIAPLKRKAAYLTQGNRSLEYDPISAKTKKELNMTVESIERSQEISSNQGYQEKKCDDSRHAPRDSRFMPEMTHFTYEKEYRLLGCRLCATMVTRQRIKEHLRGRPHQLNSGAVKKVQEWASQLDIIDNGEISGLPLLPDDAPAIDVLGPPKTGGFRCTVMLENREGPSMCRFVGSDTRRIREHSKHERGWDPGLRPGRASKATMSRQGQMPWRGGALYQRLFLKGPRSEFFEVLRGTTIHV
jgi:hypothetical protein